MGQSIWRFPDLSFRWWPVFLRNLLVWRKLAIPSLIGNIAEPLIWLVAFGYGMGALVGQVAVDGVKVPYILFLASGSICMSAMNAASFEALYSAFSRMHVQKTWDGIMNAPVGLDDIVLAEMLWAAFKSIFTVTAILFVMLGLGISHSPKLIVAWMVLVGDTWFAGAVALRMDPSTQLLIDGDERNSPWLPPGTLAREGGMVLILDTHEFRSEGALLQPRLALADCRGTLDIPWAGTDEHNRLRMRWGIVLPQGDRAARNCAADAKK